METWKKNLVAIWFGTLIVSASFSMVVPFLPLFLLQIGVQHYVETWSGLLYSIAYFGGAISAPYWGTLADKYGRKPMIIRAGFVLFATYSLTAFVHNPYEILALRLAQGLLSGFIPNSISSLEPGNEGHVTDNSGLARSIELRQGFGRPFKNV